MLLQRKVSHRRRIRHRLHSVRSAEQQRRLNSGAVGGSSAGGSEPEDASLTGMEGRSRDKENVLGLLDVRRPLEDVGRLMLSADCSESSMNVDVGVGTSFDLEWVKSEVYEKLLCHMYVHTQFVSLVRTLTLVVHKL